jgi:hypothetical protein
MEEVIFKPIRKIRIQHEGYNMSFIVHPDNKNQYLATFRVSYRISEDDYPSVENKVYLARLDSSFQVMESKLLIEPNRKIHKSYTTGLEDCRIIDGSTITGILLDNSEHWIPEMCICDFDRNTCEIKKITVFNTNTGQPKPEKNWLVLNATQHTKESVLFMLYSYDPLRIMSVNINTGECQVVHFQKIFNLDNCELHGGASIYLEKERKYLVLVRILNDHVYYFSMWILLNEQYKVCGVSKTFTFSGHPMNDTPICEMCMSLVQKKEFLYASVSINDQEIYVYEFFLKDIIQNTNIDNMI